MAGLFVLSDDKQTDIIVASNSTSGCADDLLSFRCFEFAIGRICSPSD